MRAYLRVMFPQGEVPQWVRDAMAEAGIDLTGVVSTEVGAEPQQQEDE